MNHECRFSVKRKEFSKVLRNLKVAGKKGIQVEVTVTNGRIDLRSPGASFWLPATTSGSAKASFDLTHLIRVIGTYQTANLTIGIVPDKLFIGGYSFAARTTFFADDTILRSVDLPANYTDLDLLLLEVSQMYTPQELAFHKVDSLIADARVRLEDAIDNAVAALKPFGISRKLVEGLVTDNITRLAKSRKH
ncbi:MAG: hypothetical protein JNL40_10685 [Cyclobacteriaceae bacterium]|nr:hypothetical protein [Cyclobacteriaceae bacterium]